MSVFLGDGSFEDCVQLGVFAEMSEGDLNTLYLEKGYFPALSNTSVPAVVVDYVGSVVQVFDMRFSGWCSVSDVVVAERLRKNYVRNVSRGTAYAFSKCLSSFGKRLFQYKLFELPSSEHRIDRGDAYANHQLRMAHSREMGVGLNVLKDLANSLTPADFVMSNFDVVSDSEDCLFRSVFFNKNLSFDDVVWLWDSMVCQSNSCFLDCPHVFLLQSALLRDDWSEDELRFFFEWWMDYSSMLNEQLAGEELRNEFHMLSNSVKILFALNVSTPVDLLLNLFEGGDESVRSAVVRNSAVGKDFVFDVVNGGVIDSSVVRESALLNSAWGFEELVNVVEDESDRVMKTLDSVKETGRKISLEKIFALFDREFSLTINIPLYLKKL